MSNAHQVAKVASDIIEGRIERKKLAKLDAQHATPTNPTPSPTPKRRTGLKIWLALSVFFSTVSGYVTLSAQSAAVYDASPLSRGAVTLAAMWLVLCVASTLITTLILIIGRLIRGKQTTSTASTAPFMNEVTVEAPTTDPVEEGERLIHERRVDDLLRLLERVGPWAKSVQHAQEQVAALHHQQAEARLRERAATAPTLVKYVPQRARPFTDIYTERERLDFNRGFLNDIGMAVTPEDERGVLTIAMPLPTGATVKDATGLLEPLRSTFPRVYDVKCFESESHGAAAVEFEVWFKEPPAQPDYLLDNTFGDEFFEED